MELLLVNLASSKRVSEGNREYLVAPLTLIVPGVLNGSQGPLYYPPEEIKRTTEAWNEIPITLRHPRKNGNLVSAKDGGVKLGTIRNARYEDKLVADAWFDLAALNEESPQLLGPIESGEQTEISTGLYTDNKPVKNGEHNGHEYTHVATNYRPDHLAILPDEVGACSVNDGCGLNVNELSHDDLEGLLRTKLSTGASDDLWVVDVFDDYLIYRRDNKLYRLSYGKTQDEVLLSKDAPVEVKKTISYEPVTNMTKLRNKENDMPLTEEQRKKLVDNLLGCCWEKTDRPVLEGLTDNQLTRLGQNAEEAEQLTLVVNTARETLGLSKDLKLNQMPEALKKALAKKKNGDDDEEEEGDGKKKKKKKVENKDGTPKPPTKEEWLAQAPKEVQEDLAFAHTEKAKQRAEAISVVTANLDGDAKTKIEEHLETLNLEQIKDLAVLVPKPRPAANYATVPSVGNAEQKEPPMGQPTWDFTPTKSSA